MGPSLTRLLVLLPVVLCLAALGIGALLRRWPRAWPAVALALAGVLAWSGFRYFVTFAGSPAAQHVYSQSATPIGQRAAELAAGGRRVLCVVAKDVNTARYLTHDWRGAVRLVEFYRRPLDPALLGLAEFRPDVLLVERHPSFARFVARFPPARRTIHGAFEEIEVAGLL
jgi:hypothetical protein